MRDNLPRINNSRYVLSVMNLVQNMENLPFGNFQTPRTLQGGGGGGSLCGELSSYIRTQ